MFYPFNGLMEKELFAPDEGFDVEPVVLQFEVYVRLVLGIAYDRCRQLWEEARTDEEQELLGRALRIRGESGKRIVSQQVYSICVSKYSCKLECWFEKNNQNSEIVELLPEAGEKDIDVNCILKNQRNTITLGEYKWNIILMIDVIQKFCPTDKMLDFLERAIIPITIYIEMRNKNGHNLTLGHRRTLEKLRKWLQEQEDPIFTSNVKNSCELIIPYKCTENRTVVCAVRRGLELDKANIPFEFLHREKLFVELMHNPNELIGEFKNTLFLRMPVNEKGKKQYFRISPFINIKESNMDTAQAEYGMLLKNTPGGEFQYRNMQVTNDRTEGDVVTGDFYSEKEIIDFENKYCFYVSSMQEIESSKMKIIGEKTHLFISRHPEFQSVINTNRPFSYYRVIDNKENSWIEQLQKKESGIHFVFLTGHGGLGKTHLVLNLLRTKYSASYSPGGNDLRFDKVMFLSAKQTGMQVISGIEMDLDHDIENYESMINLLSEHLLPRGTKTYCNDNLESLEEELVKNGKKQFIIIDDLDTLKLEDQKRVCKFFDRFKSENHRVLITSRLVSVAVSSLVSGQSTAVLKTLDCGHSLEFCKKYIEDNELEMKDISISEIEKIHPYTCGIPLNLVMFLHLKDQGYSPDRLYSKTKVEMDQSTEFIFRHVLEALDIQARYTISMLSRFGKVINDESDMRVIGFDTLRLLVPFLSDEDYEGAIDTLNYYSIIDKSEDGTIFLRHAVFLEDLEDIRLHDESQSILEYVERDPKKWLSAIGDKRLFLNNILEIAKDWKNSGDMEKRKWAADCAQIALSTKYQEEVESGHTGNEWDNLRMGSALNIMEKLNQQVAALQQHNPEKEESIKLLVDRYYKVLETLNKCHKKWPENKEQIRQAFDVCANVLLGIYNNMSSEVDQVVSEVQNRLIKCYFDFEEYAKERVSEKCEKLLSRIGYI